MKRLVDTPELASAIEAAREEGVSAARIEASRAAVHAKIAAGGGATFGAVVAKVALLVSGVGAVIALAVAATPPRAEPERAPAEVAAPVTAEGIAVEVVSDAPPPPPGPPSPAIAPAIAPPVTPKPPTRARVLPPKPAEASPVPAAAPSKLGTLHVQIAAFEAARASAQAGRDAEAIDALERLERDHPRTPLLPEVRLARAESHARLNKFEAALADLEKAIDDPALAARRPELLRFAEDLRSRR